MEKKCLKCGRIFLKQQNYSKVYWKNRQFCSRACASSYTKNRLGKKGIKLKFTPEGLASRKLHASGSNNNFWRGGKSKLKRQIYNLYEYRQWRSGVFRRDDYTCQNCNNRGGKLEAHHITAFSVIINHYDLKTVEEAKNCSELWDINNGLTLCVSCHKKTDNYGNKAKNKKYPEFGI